MDEYERKRMLSKDEYSVISEWFDPRLKTRLQINYYYDTPDLYFDQQNISVRIRQKDDQLKGTIKSHGKNQSFYSCEQPFDADTLPPTINYDSKMLICMGQLVTERKILSLGDGLSLMLDKNYFLGLMDYELELEYIRDTENKAIMLLQQIESQLCSKTDNNKQCQNRSKSKRFFNALECYFTPQILEINFK